MVGVGVIFLAVRELYENQNNQTRTKYLICLN